MAENKKPERPVLKNQEEEKKLGLRGAKGFNPELGLQKFQYVDGKTYKELPAYSRLQWFYCWCEENSKAPCIETELLNSDLASSTFVVEAKVFADGELLASAQAYRTKAGNINPLEWAATAAVAKALRFAGFGLEFENSSTSGLEIAPQGAKPQAWAGSTVKSEVFDFSAVAETAPSAKPEAVAPPESKKTEATPPKTVPAPVDKKTASGRFVPQDIPKSYEEALQIICPKSDGLTFAYIIAQGTDKQRGMIKWLASKEDPANPSAAATAARLIVEHGDI